MKKLIAFSALLILTGLLAPRAMAYPEHRWYFAFGFNEARPHFRGELGEPRWKSTWGTNIRIGHLVTDYFAFEASYQHFERFKASDIPFPRGFRETMICGQNVTVGAKGYLKLDRFISLYGTLGAGFLRAEFDYLTRFDGRREITADIESDFAYRAAAGVNIYLSRRLALEAELSYNEGGGRVRDLRFSAASIQALVRF